ncbi:MAG: 2Fe-2S iron-sulfur cluster binding domain-containing protein [Myxococcales bacterium]|nr:2Fe-2S iron-sulfur cluster binding domain-containing protein [Myxococcales bacterium]
MTAKVRFLPADVTVEVAAGTTLFDAGGRITAGIETACVGKGTCGLCRVKVIEGDAALSPYTDVEERHLGNLYRITRLRLACQVRIDGDVTVEIKTRRRPRP